LDDARQPVRTDEAGFIEWMMGGGDEKRVVGFTELPGFDYFLAISTVFIPTKMSGGRFFETALLREDDTQIVARYRTWAEAAAGHEAVIREVLTGHEAREGAG
jgi:hypothetical protein